MRPIAAKSGLRFPYLLLRRLRGGKQEALPSGASSRREGQNIRAQIEPAHTGAAHKNEVERRQDRPSRVVGAVAEVRDPLTLELEE